MRRWLLAAVLICAFIALAAYYATNITYHLDNPRESEVNTNYEAYVGRTVTISGEVASAGAQSFALKGESATYTILSSVAVKLGDRITVVGTLEPAHQLQAGAMYASPRLLGTLVYVRSFVALIFVVVFFFACWRFDRRGWIIRPRKPSLQKRDGS